MWLRNLTREHMGRKEERGNEGVLKHPSYWSEGGDQETDHGGGRTVPSGDGRALQGQRVGGRSFITKEIGRCRPDQAWELRSKERECGYI